MPTPNYAAVFGRTAYSDINQLKNPRNQATYENSDPKKLATFSGGNYSAWINNVRVGTLESVTYNIQRETAPIYALGDNSPLNFVRGKRGIMGAMVFGQFDRHAILRGVFNIDPGSTTYGDLWKADSFNSNSSRLVNYPTGTTTATSAISGAPGSTRNVALAIDLNQSYADNGAARRPTIAGISPVDFNNQLKDQIVFAADLMQARKIQYVDELPAFDLTLVGVNDLGRMSSMTLFGIHTTQETGGISMSDMGGAQGFSFTCTDVLPLTPLEVGAGNDVYVPGVY